MTYRSPHRWQPDDAEASHDARLRAALMHLAYFLGHDGAGDRLACYLSDDVYDGIPEGVDSDTADAVAAAIKDNLDASYAGNPEACLSYITATVADMRKKEKSK